MCDTNTEKVLRHGPDDVQDNKRDAHFHPPPCWLKKSLCLLLIFCRILKTCVQLDCLSLACVCVLELILNYLLVRYFEENGFETEESFPDQNEQYHARKGPALEAAGFQSAQTSHPVTEPEGCGTGKHGFQHPTGPKAEKVESMIKENLVSTYDFSKEVKKADLDFGKIPKENPTVVFAEGQREGHLEEYKRDEDFFPKSDTACLDLSDIQDVENGPEHKKLQTPDASFSNMTKSSQGSIKHFLDLDSTMTTLRFLQSNIRNPLGAGIKVSCPDFNSEPSDANENPSPNGGGGGKNRDGDEQGGWGSEGGGGGRESGFSGGASGGSNGDGDGNGDKDRREKKHNNDIKSNNESEEDEKGDSEEEEEAKDENVHAADLANTDTPAPPASGFKAPLQDKTRVRGKPRKPHGKLSKSRGTTLRHKSQVKGRRARPRDREMTGARAKRGRLPPADDKSISISATSSMQAGVRRRMKNPPDRRSQKKMSQNQHPPPGARNDRDHTRAPRWPGWSSCFSGDGETNGQRGSPSASPPQLSISRKEPVGGGARAKPRPSLSHACRQTTLRGHSKTKAKSGAPKLYGSNMHKNYEGTGLTPRLLIGLKRGTAGCHKQKRQPPSQNLHLGTNTTTPSHRDSNHFDDSLARENRVLDPPPPVQCSEDAEQPPQTATGIQEGNSNGPVEEDVGVNNADYPALEFEGDNHVLDPPFPTQCQEDVKAAEQQRCDVASQNSGDGGSDQGGGAGAVATSSTNILVRHSTRCPLNVRGTLLVFCEEDMIREKEPQTMLALEENRRLRRLYRCRMCLCRQFTIVFAPCGHLACAHCSSVLTRCHCGQAILGKHPALFGR